MASDKHAFHENGWTVQLAVELVACVAFTVFVLFLITLICIRLSYMKKMRQLRQQHGENTKIIGFFHPNW